MFPKGKKRIRLATNALNSIRRRPLANTHKTSFASFLAGKNAMLGLARILLDNPRSCTWRISSSLLWSDPAIRNSSSSPSNTAIDSGYSGIRSPPRSRIGGDGPALESAATSKRPLPRRLCKPGTVVPSSEDGDGSPSSSHLSL